MHRLDNSDEDYFAEVAESEELLSLMDRLILTMSRTVEQCREFRKQFLQYRHLWTVRAFLSSPFCLFTFAGCVSSLVVFEFEFIFCGKFPD